MRVMYIAKHDSGGNDEEGAVGHAFEQLGWEVDRLREIMGHKAMKLRGDFLLFHKWNDLTTLKLFAGIVPRVFWYFDLVDSPDPTLAVRCQERRQWMQDTIPHVEQGFLTDGDWVETNPKKLTWLPQAADSRMMGHVHPTEEVPILFTGIGYKGGQARESFVKEMQDTYQSQFRHVVKGSHGMQLAKEIANAQIVVAPDGPVSDRYWSNRVFLTLGYGRFLLHPDCKKLHELYEDKREIVYYRDRSHLHKLIRYYLHHPEERKAIADAGFKRTLAEHTYVHRVSTLLAILKQKKLL